MVIRKVAMLQLDVPDTRLTIGAQATIDAVTGRRITEEAFDLIEN
jgi:hypothetical protein